MSDTRPRIVILMLTYGEPPVPDFRKQYRYSLSILRRLTRKVAPIPRPILPLIALYRGLGRVRMWRKEVYGSPLEQITERQREFLERELQVRDPAHRYEIFKVYEFREPLLGRVLKNAAPSSRDRVLLLPMYLADSDFTTGISRRDLELFEKRFGKMRTEPRYVSSFSADTRLAEVAAEFVLKRSFSAWGSFSSTSPPNAPARRGLPAAKTALILGAHGTLVHGPAGMDTGLAATVQFYENLAAFLKPHFGFTSIGWLNHALGGEWTSPNLEAAIEKVIAQDLREAVYFPFGFFADNAESELEGRRIFRKFRQLEVLHLPCLNDWPPFISYLADRVGEALSGERVGAVAGGVE